MVELQGRRDPAALRVSQVDVVAQAVERLKTKQ
jgi:hypothetical protein